MALDGDDIEQTVGARSQTLRAVTDYNLLMASWGQVHMKMMQKPTLTTDIQPKSMMALESKLTFLNMLTTTGVWEQPKFFLQTVSCILIL